MEKNKKKVKRLIQYPFKFFTPIQLAYPIILFEGIKDLNIDKYKAAVLYKDTNTKEQVLFLIESNTTFHVLVLPKAVSNVIASKTKNAIVIMNSKLEDVDKSEGRIVPFAKENIDLMVSPQ